uniref:Uncharacterized protein n=1 Tax=Parascaris univalens TaxID=6257 RepID=A0A915BEH3_PARUN
MKHPRARQEARYVELKNASSNHKQSVKQRVLLAKVGDWFNPDRGQFDSWKILLGIIMDQIIDKGCPWNVSMDSNTVYKMRLCVQLDAQLFGTEKSESRPILYRLRFNPDRGQFDSWKILLGIIMDQIIDKGCPWNVSMDSNTVYKMRLCVQLDAQLFGTEKAEQWSRTVARYMEQVSRLSKTVSILPA